MIIVIGFVLFFSECDFAVEIKRLPDVDSRQRIGAILFDMKVIWSQMSDLSLRCKAKYVVHVSL